MESCWTQSKPPQHPHILHTCPPSYSSQRHQTPNHFEVSADTAALLEKLHHLLRFPILHIFCKLLILCKNARLHCSWCQCSHLYCHPWQVLLVVKPECFMCLLMLEIYLLFVYNQKLKSSWSAMYSPHPRHKWYHKNRESCTELLHQHIAFTCLLQHTTILPLPTFSIYISIYINEPTTKPCDTLISAYPPKYPTSPFPTTKLSKAFQFTLRILNINLILVIIIFHPTHVQTHQ